MNIKYAIQGSIDKESAQKVLAVSNRIAQSLEGQIATKTIEIDSTKAIIKVNGDFALVLILTEGPTGIVFHPRSGSIERLPYTEYVRTDFGVYPETKYIPGVAGGWRDGKTELNTEYIYPLVDADNASFLISKEDDSEELIGEFLGESGNYGNLYWWNGDEEDSIFLSWKGPSTRHFRVPSLVNIPGYSEIWSYSPSLVDDIPRYTTFTQYIYQDGIVATEAPEFSWPYRAEGFIGNRCIVLGACINKTDNKIYTVTLSDHRAAPKYFVSFSDGEYRTGASSSVKDDYLQDHEDVTAVLERDLTSPGFFLTLWREGNQFQGWDFVAEHQYGDYGIPFFPDTDGTAFVSGRGDKLMLTGDFQEYSVARGSYTETATLLGIIEPGNSHGIPAGTKIYDPNDLKTVIDYKTNSFYEYMAQQLISSQIKVTSNTFSNNYTTEAKEKTNSFVVPVTLPAGFSTGGIITTPAKNATNNGFVIGGIFTVDWFTDPIGCDEAECVWSITGTTVRSTGPGAGCSAEVVSSNCCGTCVVTVTRGAFSASTEVLFTGKWVLESDIRSTTTYYYTCTATVIEGGTRYDYTFKTPTIQYASSNPCESSASYVCAYEAAYNKWWYYSKNDQAFSPSDLGSFSTDIYRAYTNCQSWGWLFGNFPAPISRLQTYKWVC